jgi:nickel transport protein
MGRHPAIALLVVLLALLPSLSFGHASRVTWTRHAGSIEIRANFDDGSPVARAQVIVYSPADPSTPWLTGETEVDGSFSFEPDTTLDGTWGVMVRSAGHGDIVHIDLSRQAGLSASPDGDRSLSTGQIVLMSVCVVWGLVGTALFFAWRIRSRRART